MKHRIDDADAIESNCYAPPLGVEGPTDEVCGADATTYVLLPSGVRKYICADHAAQVDRFGDDIRDDHPHAVVCDACQKIAPKDKVDFDGRCEDCQL